MAEAGPRIRILCLGGQAQLRLAAEMADAEVTSAETVEEALGRLREGGFAAVVAEPNLLGSLLEKARRRENDVVLDILNEGICITDAAGHIQWSNRTFRRWGAEVAELVMRYGQMAARRLGAAAGATPSEPSPAAAANGAAGAPDRPAGRQPRYSFRERTRDGRHCEVTVTPILDEQGRMVKLMGVVTERTAQVLLQQRMAAIEEAGRKLLHLEPQMVSRMTPDERLSMLQKQIIALTRNLLMFDHFRIRLLKPESNRLELVLTEGLREGEEGAELFAEEVGSGISGYVAATGQPYICNDGRSDPRYLPGLVHARSSLTVPLGHHDRVVGTFNVESRKAGAFGQPELQALEIFSHYVAQALVTLQLLIAEKVSTTDQLAADVTEELRGPLDGILSAAGRLKAEYIGHDEPTRRHLDEIVSAVDRIRQIVRQVADARRPLRGASSLAGAGATPLAGRRFLVADDEPTIRKTLSEVLGSLGAAVDLARDGGEAVAMGVATPYDLVLADIRMPHKNGYEVFREIRDAHPDVPIILMTAFGYDPSHSVVRAREKGLKAVLFKPFKIQALYQQIGEALGIATNLPMGG